MWTNSSRLLHLTSPNCSLKGATADTVNHAAHQYQGPAARLPAKIDADGADGGVLPYHTENIGQWPICSRATRRRSGQENVEKHPVEALLTDGADDRHVTEFVEGYLRPLKRRWGTTRMVEIADTGFSMMGWAGRDGRSLHHTQRLVCQ